MVAGAAPCCPRGEGAGRRRPDGDCRPWRASGRPPDWPGARRRVHGDWPAQPWRRRHGRGPLRRSRDDRLIAGVAGGLSERLGVDVTIVRVGLVLLALASGFGVAGYVLAWLLLPIEGEKDTIAVRAAMDRRGIALGDRRRPGPRRHPAGGLGTRCGVPGLPRLAAVHRRRRSRAGVPQRRRTGAGGAQARRRAVPPAELPAGAAGSAPSPSGSPEACCSGSSGCSSCCSATPAGPQCSCSEERR